jgi:hypothetical protein
MTAKPQEQSDSLAVSRFLYGTQIQQSRKLTP